METDPDAVPRGPKACPAGIDRMAFFMAIAGMITVFQAGAFMLGKADLQNSLALVRHQQDLSQGFGAAVFMACIFASLRISSLSEGRRDRFVWRAMTVFFAFLALSQVMSFAPSTVAYGVDSPGSFGKVWAGILFMIAVAALSGGWILLESLRGSYACRQPIFWGTLIYLIGAVGTAVMLAGAYDGNRQRVFAEIKFVLNGCLKMSGLMLLLSGLLAHERFLISRSGTDNEREVFPGKSPETAAGAEGV
ncbi:MAG: hypothetical protein FGM27_02525 [Candidatus Omnitrophica bacterium]|nr:hypothetical protein [Candidatus Omnitrophota bacterium]